MKKTLFAVITLIAAIIITIGVLVNREDAPAYDFPSEYDGVRTSAYIDGDDFYINAKGTYEKQFLKGVNIGATKPGFFPGSLAITKAEYLRWFEYISEMNANTIRVYTTMQPHFYEALKEHNEETSTPLYLMQGVWINENDIAELKDPYADERRILDAFIKDSKDLVDIFHGNAELPSRPGFASGSYEADVSEYVIGWMLGIEWDPYFVKNTNETHEGLAQYEGTMLHTENASPFEIFLSEAADTVMTYEANTYNETRPLSFTNWLTTDPLNHPNEPDPVEDMVSVNVEHITLEDKAFAGQFATYHVYPYYPEFMNVQPSYTDFIDEEGNVNTYKAYLRDLKTFHNIPVMVGEFGVPSSRGKAHNARYSGFDQGNLTEQEQGEALRSMSLDIVDENYMGALIFAFQDEWFKRTWNTMDYSLSWRRPFWNDVETNEQMFGLLSFDPGEETLVHLDGDSSEWSEDDLVHETGEYALHTKHDERYLYLMVKADATIKNKEHFIAFDTIPEQGNTTYDAKNLEFARGTEFIVHIKDNASRLMVDPYYDTFNHHYATMLSMVEADPYSAVKDSGTFNRIHHALSSELYLPLTEETIPFEKYETGALTKGISDPSHESFNSLADYYYGEDFVEIRLPWLLLNIMDPSTKMMMDDFHETTPFTATAYDAIHLGVGNASAPITFGSYTYEEWTLPTYHERLKESYYIVKDTFETID